LSGYERLGHEELDALHEIEARGGGGVQAGGFDIEELIARVADQRSRLADQLPPMAPDDLCLLGASMLFDEVERKAVVVGPRISRGLPTVAPELARRQIEAASATVVRAFDIDDTPVHTPDRKDDYIVEMALRGAASAIVSDDRRHIAQTADVPTWYQDARTGSVVAAYQLELFVKDQVNSLHFDLDDVDPSLLGLALRPVR